MLRGLRTEHPTDSSRDGTRACRTRLLIFRPRTIPFVLICFPTNGPLCLSNFLRPLAKCQRQNLAQKQPGIARHILEFSVAWFAKHRCRLALSRVPKIVRVSHGVDNVLLMPLCQQQPVMPRVVICARAASLLSLSFVRRKRQVSFSNLTRNPRQRRQWQTSML